MNINQTNYGAWFIDYYDGTLSAEKTAELFLFLEQHPDLKLEFESFYPVQLDAEPVFFIDKQSLKKDEVNEINYEHYLVAELEGDLNLQDRMRLKEFMSNHPHLEKERELVRLTKLDGEKEIYPFKKSLKKKTVTAYAAVRMWTAVAAAILLVAGLLYINRPKEKQDTAEKKPVEQQDDSLRDFYNSAPLQAELPENSPSIKSQEKTENIQRIYTAEKKKNAEESERIAPIQLAERKGITTNPVQFDAVPQRDILFAHASDQPALNVSGLQEKIAELKDKAATKVNTVTGDEILYSSTVTEDPATEKIPLKSRMFKFAAWAVGRISNDKIKMENTFDQSGNIAAYQVSAGKLKYEKDF